MDKLVQTHFKVKSKRKHKAKVQQIIMQDRKECYVTHRTDGLCLHHIFHGNGKRALSDKYGLFVWLLPEYHNMSDKGVHFNPALDLHLKQEAQMKFEAVYSRDEFIRLFGKSYL